MSDVALTLALLVLTFTSDIFLLLLLGFISLFICLIIAFAYVVSGIELHLHISSLDVIKND